jgi:hypothetical protein
VKRPIRSAHTRAMLPIVAAESACSKDAETKLVAQKLRDQASASAADLTMLLGGRP